MVEDVPKAAHNQLHIPSDAAEYMAGLNGELISDHIVIGWAELPKLVPNPKPSEDAVYAYVDPDSGNGLFGVFDGAGGHKVNDRPMGRDAAFAARQSLHEETLNNGDTVPANPKAELDRIFTNMATRVDAEATGGITTAIVGLLHNGAEKPRFEWGAAGDSLGFLIRNGSITQLNKEETVRQNMLDLGYDESQADRHGSIITNALGTTISEEGAEDQSFKGLEQKGSFEVEEGDVVVFVSDGITGDNAKQRLWGIGNLAVILDEMSHSDLSPQQKAQRLIQLATKVDDRSALVVQFGSHNESLVAASVEEDDVLPWSEDDTLPPIAPGRLGPTAVKSAMMATRPAVHTPSQIMAEPEALGSHLSGIDVLAAAKTVFTSAQGNDLLLGVPGLDTLLKMMKPADRKAFETWQIEQAAVRPATLTEIISQSPKNSVGVHEVPANLSEELEQALSVYSLHTKGPTADEVQHGVRRAKNIGGASRIATALLKEEFYDARKIKELTGGRRGTMVSFDSVMYIDPSLIKSAAKFDTWAGRGQSGEGYKSYVRADGRKMDGGRSIDAITDYATRSTQLPWIDSLTLKLIITRDGPVFSASQGGHRIAAAKLRGEPLRVSSLVIHDVR